MRSCRIINCMSSSVETTEVEVLYEKQQGLKQTHSVGCHGTCAILHAVTHHLHLYNTYYSPVLIPLNHFFSCGSPLLHPSHTHRSAPHLGSPSGAGLVWADTALSHGAAEVEAQIFIFAPITPLFLVFFCSWHKSGGTERRNWWPS